MTAPNVKLQQVEVREARINGLAIAGPGTSRMRPLDGLRSFWGGVGFVVKTPRVWGFAAIPSFVALTLLGTCTGLGIWLAVRMVRAGDSHWDTAQGIAVGVAAPFVGFVVALALSQPLSGFALDRIVTAQQEALGLPPAEDKVSLAAATFRSLRVTLLGLVCGLPLLALLALITALVPPAGIITVPLKFIVSALLVAWDFLDYPFSLYGVGVRGRLSFMGHHFGAVLAFGMACAAVLLLPGVGLLMLPMGVAAGTRLLAIARLSVVGTER
jgi:CysZ protein